MAYRSTEPAAARANRTASCSSGTETKLVLAQDELALEQSIAVSRPLIQKFLESSGSGRAALGAFSAMDEQDIKDLEKFESTVSVNSQTFDTFFGISLWAFSTEDQEFRRLADDLHQLNSQIC